ncbi:hypothetical protein E2C01_049727 [Portunus trituberculatus]|uniref:Uncharacterized protein n=1 Tax=Portunus trituberculatus TaxID=210409 RepID=A0A5B7GA85_PORTR|nr:hypothetical protein [Portunus trituberculatus]
MKDLVGDFVIGNIRGVGNFCSREATTQTGIAAVSRGAAKVTSQLKPLLVSSVADLANNEDVGAMETVLESTSAFVQQPPSPAVQEAGHPPETSQPPCYCSGKLPDVCLVSQLAVNGDFQDLQLRLRRHLCPIEGGTCRKQRGTVLLAGHPPHLCIQQYLS